VRRDFEITDARKCPKFHKTIFKKGKCEIKFNKNYSKSVSLGYVIL
jgi:hypothetical protein